MMWILLTLGCADVTGIDRGARANDVIVIKDWFTSAQLLKTDDGAVLFDAGFRAGTMERRLEDEGVALSDLRHVFLTHGHTDHLGLLVDRADALDVTVHGFADEQPVLDEETDGSVSIDAPLTDGTPVQVGQFTIEPFAVPGHTPGSAVFLVDGVLLVGDSALVDRDGRLVPVPENRSDDPAQLVQSMEALAERLEPRADAIDWIVPSHSAMASGFEPLRSFCAE